MVYTMPHQTRMVKKYKTLAGTVPRHHGLGQGSWVVQSGRFGGLRWVGDSGRQRGGFDLEIGSDEFFDHTG
jgi:hypothetical protein